VSSLFREVQQLWFDNSDKPAKYLADLQDLGSSLFEQLFPQDLSQLVLDDVRGGADARRLRFVEPGVGEEGDDRVGTRLLPLRHRLALDAGRDLTTGISRLSGGGYQTRECAGRRIPAPRTHHRGTRR